MYDGDVKNFVCKVTGNTEQKDENCQIFKLDFPDSTKALDLKAIGAVDGTKELKDTVAADTFYKLTINTSKFTTFDLSKTVELSSTKTGQENKKYGVFSLLHEINGDTVTGETYLLIGKVKANAQTFSATSGALKCKIDNLIKTPVDCVIYKFTDTLGVGKTFKDHKFSVISPVSSQTDMTKDKYVVIDLKKENKQAVSKLTNKITTVICTKENNNTTLAEVIVESSLAFNDSNSNKTAIILS